jgi:hypothetical protein
MTMLMLLCCLVNPEIAQPSKIDLELSTCSPKDKEKKTGFASCLSSSISQRMLDLI